MNFEICYRMWQYQQTMFSLVQKGATKTSCSFFEKLSSDSFQVKIRKEMATKPSLAFLSSLKIHTEFKFENNLNMKLKKTRAYFTQFHCGNHNPRIHQGTFLKEERKLSFCRFWTYKCLEKWDNHIHYLFFFQAAMAKQFIWSYKMDKIRIIMRAERTTAFFPSYIGSILSMVYKISNSDWLHIVHEWSVSIALKNVTCDFVNDIHKRNGIQRLG